MDTKEKLRQDFHTNILEMIDIAQKIHKVALDIYPNHPWKFYSSIKYLCMRMEKLHPEQTKQMEKMINISGILELLESEGVQKK